MTESSKITHPVRIIVMVLLLLCHSLGAVQQPSQTTSPQVKIIALVKYIEKSPYNSAIEGFKEILKKEQISFSFKIYNPDDENIIKEIQSEQPTLILTTSASSAKYISEKIRDIPIVFTMILDPKGSNLTSRNIVGASLDIPAQTQLECLQSVIPNLRQVGVIFNPSENERIVKEAQLAANRMGIVLKTYPVNSTSEIPKIKNLEIDALWIIPDSTVCQTTIVQRILLCSLRNKVPVMGFSRYYAKAGTLLAVTCDYEDIGRQSGEIAVRLLKGENYSRLKISEPRKVKMYLNKTVADHLKIKISKDIIKKANEVF